MRCLINVLFLALLAGIGGATFSGAAEGKGAVDERIQSTFDAVEKGLNRTSTPVQQVEKSAPTPAPLPATDSGKEEDSQPLLEKLATQEGSPAPSTNYPGHGEYNAQTETSCWLPVDASRDDTTKWLESRSISDQLKLITTRHILVVADSCFSGTITRSTDSNLSGKIYTNSVAS